MLSFPAKCNTTHLMLSDLFSLCNVHNCVMFCLQQKWNIQWVWIKKSYFPQTCMVYQSCGFADGCAPQHMWSWCSHTHRIWKCSAHQPNLSKKKRREIHTNQKKRMSPSSKWLNNHVYKKWVNGNYTLFVILKSAWNENSLNLYCKYMLLILLWTIHTCMFHVLIKLSFYMIAWFLICLKTNHVLIYQSMPLLNIFFLKLECTVDFVPMHFSICQKRVTNPINLLGRAFHIIICIGHRFTLHYIYI